MSYTYEVWNRGSEPLYQHTLRSESVPFESLEDVFKEEGAYINVKRNGVSDALLLNPDDLGVFRETLERNYAWKPTPIDNNKKTAVAMGKATVTNIPPVAFFAMGAAMKDGADKYGRYNWRDDGATISVFVDAMMRHLMDYWNGENYADDSKVHHLAHLMAGCAILLDAGLHGKLNDDRGDHDRDNSISRVKNYWKAS